MKAISLMYHDIVTSKEDLSSSGFDSPDANHYKVDSVDFLKHLEKIYSDSKEFKYKRPKDKYDFIKIDLVNKLKKGDSIQGSSIILSCIINN